MTEKEIPNLRLAASKSKIYSEVDGLSLQNLFYAYNEYFPNCYMFTNNSREGRFYIDTKAALEYFQKNTPDDEQLETIVYMTENISKKETLIGFCVLLHKSNLFARVERNESESYILFDNQNYDEMIKFKNKLLEFYKPEEEEKNNFYTISSTQQGFQLLKNPVKEIKNFDVLKLYNDDFIIQDAKIQNFIKKDDTSGIIMLHGTKGTGKTTYIRHLINTNPDKRFVLIPAGLIEMLGTPNFQSFLLSLTNHIIILEDCENALKDRKTNMNASAVSLLLNMSDGLLSDGLGLKFICTFNEDIKDMDEAITRKGRLLAKYEFKPLTLDKTNALLKEAFTLKSENLERYGRDSEGHIYQCYYDMYDDTFNVNDVTNEPIPDDAVIEELPTSSKPMTLADIFNYDEESYVTERKKII